MKYMYVGPSIVGAIAQNTIYEDAPLPGLQTVIDEHPYVRGLCIPQSNWAAALRQINLQEGGVFQLFQKAQTELKTTAKYSLSVVKDNAVSAG